MLISDVPLAQALLKTKPVERLGKISFLGGIDRFNTKLRQKSGSRLDHSVSVAQIVLDACVQRDYSESQINIAVSAALLHDIGHTIFSHSGERYLSDFYHTDHIEQAIDILNGDVDVKQTLKEFNCNLDDIFSIITGHAQNEFAFILSSPINADTIDGITRTLSSFGIGIEYGYIDGLIDFVAKPHKSTQKSADYFWKLKDIVYRNIINDKFNAQYDDWIYQTLVQNKVSLRDLYNDEGAFDAAPSSANMERSERRHRIYFIDREIDISSDNDVFLRYRRARETDL
jgi:uncharacterized protein